MNQAVFDNHVPARHKRRAPKIVIPFGKHSRFDKHYAFDSSAAINGHMLMAGPSGSGKSHQLNRVILSLAEQGAQIHTIDVHGDLGDFSDIARHRAHPIPDNLVQTIEFGEHTPHGLPPLDLLPGIGPRRRANSFINLLERQSVLGPKQKTALFRMLMDLYQQHGFLQEDPKTWTLEYDPRRKAARVVTPRPGMIALPDLNWFDKSQTEKDSLKADYGLKFNGEGSTKFWEVAEDHPRAAEAQERWGSSDAKRYPTLADVRRHLWDRLVMMKTGQSAPAIRALDKVMKLAATRARLRTKKINEALQDDLDKLEAQLGKAQSESMDAFKDGMEKLDNGHELEDLLLWDSADAVKGLFDRIEALERSGIFKGTPPLYDTGIPVKRYDIRDLSDPEQVLFVDVLLEHIFAIAKARGEADGPDTFILLDEAHKFVVDDGDHIINRIVKEARKFGIGIILASQAFVHFSDDLLMSSGLKVVLGCPEMYREPMRRKLGLDMVTLKSSGNKVNPLSLIRPKDTAMISITTAGENSPMADIKIVAA
jgi:hypothetical protein